MAASRRTWKKSLRQARIYLPLGLLLLTSLIIFLPIRSSWIGGKIENAVLSSTGIPLDIGAFQIVLWDGQADLSRISIGNGDVDGGSFHVAHAVAEGSFRGLLSGGHSWPDVVRVESPGRLVIQSGSDGFHVVGEWNSLFELLTSNQNRTKNTKNPEGKDPAKDATQIGRTPKVVVSNLGVIVEHQDTGHQSLRLTIDNLIIDERLSSDSPIAFYLSGILTTEKAEAIKLRGMYFPDDERLTLTGNLSGFRWTGLDSPLGFLEADFEDIEVTLNLRRRRDGIITSSIAVESDRADLRQRKLGGARWIDKKLQLRANATFSPETQKLVVSQLSVDGERIDMVARGDVVAKGAFPGNAELTITQIPEALLTIGRAEILEPRGVRLTQETSGTLRLEARVQGDFSEPENLDGSASIRIRGWRLDASDLPRPLEIRNVNLIVNRDAMSIRDIDLKLGDLLFRASGELPILESENDPKGVVSIEARGPFAEGFSILRDYNLTSPDLLALNMDGRLEASIDTGLFWKSPTEITPVVTNPRAIFQWSEGTVVVRQILDPLEVKRGRLDLADGTLKFSGLHASAGQILVTADGTISGGPIQQKQQDPLVLDGIFNVRGSIPEISFYLNQYVDLPRLPSNLGGTMSLNLRGTVNTDALAEADYTGSLTLEDVTANVPIPHFTLPITKLDLKIEADEQGLRLRDGALHTIEERYGETIIRFNGAVTESGVRIDLDLDSQLEFLTTIIPRDLQSVYMTGKLGMVAWAEITPKEPLPPGADVIQRWVALLRKPDLTINNSGDPDLMVSYLAEYQRNTPIEITPRDFPFRMNNIRGSFYVDSEGIHGSAIRADVGSSQDMLISDFLLEFGGPGKPTKITAKTRANSLNLNEWFSGWGQQPWSSPVMTFPSRTKHDVPEYNRLIVDVEVETGALDFMEYRADSTKSTVSFRIPSESPPHMTAEIQNSYIYEGTATGDLYFEFPKGRAAFLRADLMVQDVNVKSYMDALLARDQSMDGYAVARASFTGELLNYPTYKGEATYRIYNSTFAKSVVPLYLQGLMNLTQPEDSYISELRGSVTLEDERAVFPDFELRSPAVFGTADGSVDFRGRLSFDITASFISNRLKNVPIIGTPAGIFVDLLGKSVVSYRLEGTVKEPKVRTMPTIQRQLESLGKVLSDPASRNNPGN